MYVCLHSYRGLRSSTVSSPVAFHLNVLRQGHFIESGGGRWDRPDWLASEP